MIKELRTNNIIREQSVFVQVCRGDDIYDMEWMLIDKYNCYYWNGGDFNNCTKHHIGDVKDHDIYFQISYNYLKNINIMREVVYIGINKIAVSSKIINREKKLKKLIKKCSEKVI